LQREGFGGVRYIDTDMSKSRYVDEFHGIQLKAPEDAVPRGLLAEELQHAIDYSSGFHSPQRVAANRRMYKELYNEYWHKGVFARIADAIESDPHSIFHYFLTADDAKAFRQAAAGLPRNTGG